jgi:iron complex outermembrane recepter protein
MRGYRKLLVILLSIFIYNKIDAQTVTLKISLKTPGNDSLTNASIEIYTLPDTLLIRSKVSKPGINVLSIAPFTKYLIKVSSVGFGSVEKPISILNKPLSITVELKPKNNILSAVTVVATKPLLKQEDDKTIVDAETLANSSTSAYEVLEKAPGVVVDQDGNVYLTSSTPATIYINGRQMRMSIDDIASLLKSLPAGSVSKIEIIRTPSAKYDAANSGGIVNIVLKKGIKIGTTGSMNMRYDQGVYSMASAGFSINNSVGKINSYLSYQYTDHKYFDDIRSDRLVYSDTLLTQSSSTRYSTKTNYIGGGIDLEVTQKLDLAYDMRLTATNNNSNSVSANEISDTDHQNEFYKSETPISNDGRSFFISNTLSSKYKIDSLGSEWTNEIDYTYTRNNNTQLYTTDHIQPIVLPEYGNGAVNNPSHSEDFKTDLHLQLKDKFVLETGIKKSDVTNNNQALYYTQTGNMPQQIDPYQTNTFKYKENINSAYLQLSKTIHGLTLKSGLRFENTDITGNQLVPTDTSISIKRNDLFPYFYIKRPLFKILGYPLTGNIIYRRSITRPGYSALNPSPVFVDPFTYNVGNPGLQPEFTTNYEINSTYNDFPVFAVGVNNTSNVFSQVTYQNNATKIAYRTYDNLGRYKEIYARLFGGLPAGGKYFMYVGVQYNHIQYDGEYGGFPLIYSRGSWTFFTGHELKITPTLKFNLNAWMYANGFRLFNELKTLGQLNASVIKTLMDKKFNIIISGNDILQTNKSVFHLQQGNVFVNGTRTQDSRRFGVTLRYNFGIAPKEEKKEFFNQPPVNTED